MLPRTKAWLKRQHDQHKACVFETIREYVDFNKKLDKKQFLKTIFKVKYWGWWALLGIGECLRDVLRKSKRLAC